MGEAPDCTLPIRHSTLNTPHTPNCTLHTPHTILWTLHFPLFPPHFKFYTLHFTLHPHHNTLKIRPPTLHTLHSTLCSGVWTFSIAKGIFRSQPVCPHLCQYHVCVCAFGFEDSILFLKLMCFFRKKHVCVGLFVCTKILCFLFTALVCNLFEWEIFCV